MTPTTKKITQMTVVIPADLHKALKIHAITTGSTIVKTIEKFIEKGLKEEGKEASVK